MEYDYEEKSNRVGIYTQTSIEATAIGAGFAPRGEKSPVVIEYNHQMRATNEYSYGGNISTASANSDMSQVHQFSGGGGRFANLENPFKKDISLTDFQGTSGSGKKLSKKQLKKQAKIVKKKKKMMKNLNKVQKVHKVKNVNKPAAPGPLSLVKQFPQSEEFFGRKRWQLALAVLKKLGYASWEINAMLGNLDAKVRDGSLENVERPELPDDEPMMPIKESSRARDKNVERENRLKIVRDDLRLKIGDANTPDYAIAPEHMETLVQQINVIMLADNVNLKRRALSAVENFFNVNGALLVVCKNKWAVDLITRKLPELNRVCDGPKLVECPLGILATKTFTELRKEFPIEEHYSAFFKSSKTDKPRETNEEPDLSKVVERECRDDLRLSIGDANNPDFRILPEHRKQMLVQINLLLTSANRRKTKLTRIVVQNLLFINHRLLVVCRNKRTVDFFTHNLVELSNRCEGPRFVLCPRLGIRKKIQIILPPSDLTTREILKIIARQNELKTDPWVITNRSNEEDKVILDVVVEAETYCRFFRDQDDMHFLLARARLKEIT